MENALLKLEQIVDDLCRPHLFGEPMVPTQELNAALWRLAEKIEVAKQEPDEEWPAQMERLKALKIKARQKETELKRDQFRGNEGNAVLLRLSKILREVEG